MTALDKVAEPSIEGLGRKMIREALNYFPSTVVPAILSLVAVIIFTRVFPPSDYGLFSLVTSTISLLNILLGSWIQQYTLRYRPLYVEKGCIPAFNRNMLYSLALISGSAVLILGAVTLPIRNTAVDYGKFFLPGIILVILNLWYGNLTYILMADIRSALYSSYVTLNSLFSFVFSLAWVFHIKRDITSLLWGPVFSSLLLLIPLFSVTIGFSRIHMFVGEKAIPRSESLGYFLKNASAYGFPLIGWFFGTFLLNISDRYLIQVFRGSRAVGIYSPNYNLVMSLFMVISTPLIFAAHTLVMNMAVDFEGNKRKIQAVIESFSRYFLLVAIPLLAFTAVFSSDIARIFLGQEYREGHAVIPIILFGYLTWNFASYGHKGLELEARTGKMFLYVMICALVNILLNLLFIPWLGYLGAAITSLVSLILYPILVYYKSKAVLAWKIPWRSIGRISLSSSFLAAGMLLLKRFLSLSPILSFSLGFLLACPIYSVMIVLTGEIRASDIRVWSSLVGRIKR